MSRSDAISHVAAGGGFALGLAFASVDLPNPLVWPALVTGVVAAGLLPPLAAGFVQRIAHRRGWRHTGRPVRVHRVASAAWFALLAATLALSSLSMTIGLGDAAYVALVIASAAWLIVPTAIGSAALVRSAWKRPRA